jgi:DNA-binding NarL/FixJ family response regulator
MVMPGLGGLELAESIRKNDATLPVVFMSGYTEERPPADANAASFLQKPFSSRELAVAVRDAMQNRPAPESAAVSRLTAREREILRLIADGMTNDKVAAALAISPETVQSHVRHSMTKLEAGTRTQAVATALRQSLI